MKLLPFFCWPGAKNKLLLEIRKRYPLDLGFEEGLTKYVEPFVGGGAVLFDILSTYTLQDIFINDLNIELINAYICVRDKLSELKRYLDELYWEYNNLSAIDRKLLYYRNRDKYNSIILTNDTISVEKAALFICLTKTSFNGQFSVNKNNLYNASAGVGRKYDSFYNSENLDNISRALINVNIHTGSYDKLNFIIDSSTFVYFDPPYKSIVKSSHTSSYNSTPFGDAEQLKLAEFIKHIHRKGSKFVLSNSDCFTANGDTFFEELYAEFKIERVEIKRLISSNSAKRGSVSELLISN